MLRTTSDTVTFNRRKGIVAGHRDSATAFRLLYLTTLSFVLLEALLDASKEIGLEVNSEKTKYMFMSWVAINPLKKWQSSSIWDKH
jgi:hypothetical protein